MSWDVEDISYPVAKKAYRCDACEWINNVPIDECDLADDERHAISAAKADRYKILKGQKYIKVRGIWEGTWQTFRARIDINNICQRHDIYEC
ncbi:hypothetical protein [Sedimenticola selenatireducens]|uniref:Uncharacterized protein n=1 Tax=Sedimenticola selenatireducens TaxID=191960 RepID=A0A557SCH7_9GAMM|nr:hypothetical protein [Sedimenticola selenatireducens]TVO75106.1 hypothetical protein FHP88_08825 [Sedimenticola selenatireducens]TVT67039.1 MAG: hypothetical protein FHK78_01530 [Sedimenticola selenatireducens]